MNARESGTWPMPAIAVAVSLVYFGSAEIGLSLAYVSDQVTVVWPPTGIALVAVLLLGPPAAAGVFLGAATVNFATGASLPVAFGIAVGNTLEALAGSWILRRLDFRPGIDRLRDALALIGGAALASTTVSATAGVTTLCAGDLEPWSRFGSLWGTWWIGDAMGAIVMAPLLFTWMVPPPAAPAGRRLGEMAAVTAVTLVVSLQVFAGQPATVFGEYPLHYAVFPCVIWAALRLGPRGSASVVFVASAVAIGATAAGLGAFAARGPHEGLVLLQLFMGIVAATGLVLAAAMAERNASEQRAARDLAELEASGQRLRLALEAARLGVWDWDVRTGAVWWSDNLEAIHDLPPGSFPGTLEGFQTLVHPEDRPRVDAAIRSTIERGEPYDLEFRSVSPRGVIRWIATRGRVVRSPDGEPLRMLGTALDVSERRQLLDDLEARAHELAEADRRKNEFLAMLAHELRGPLAPLRTSLELARKDRRGLERHLNTASRQVQHLVRLIGDLLDVSRITRGKIALSRAPVALDDVVHRALEIVRPAIDRLHHRIEVSLPVEAPILDADAVRLTQVLANLLGNAATYTPAGGTITLQAETAKHEVVIRVRDTGIGLPPELLPRIFDLFVQGDASVDRPQGGLGIGLTLVRSLVELHGGRVEARSEGPGRGSEFVVRLPLSATRPLPAPAHAPAPPAPSSRRVLLVEDNRDAAESLGALLELEGHVVRIAFDGPSALETARLFRPDVVISDLGLPGMDGFAMARSLRNEDEGRTALLIALSGYGRPEDRERALEAGYDHHLVKPADVPALLALLGSGAPPAPPGDTPTSQLGKAPGVP